MKWYDSEADATYRIFGGMVLMCVLIIGAFLADKMTPELLHAMVGGVGGWVIGKSGSGNGSKLETEQAKPTEKRTRKPFRRVD